MRQLRKNDRLTSRQASALQSFSDLRRCDPRDAEYDRLRSELVVQHSGLVRSLASKFVNRGEPLDDLVQVGMLALIKAIDRFDVGRGASFTTYAAPTILGEIKRYFRDKGWAMKVPRRLKELNLAIARAVERLTVEMGHSPSSAELAEHLHASEDEVLQALDSHRAYHIVSLDAAFGDGGHRERALEQYIGTADGRLAQFEEVSNLQDAFAALNRQERVIVYWRFYDSLPQAEIARRLNVSQMHVSRLQYKALRKMRKALCC